MIEISRKNRAVQEILERMKRGPVTAKDCIDCTGLSHGTLGQYLPWMASKKLIVRIRHGMYALPRQSK